MVLLFSTAPCGWHGGSGGNSGVTCGAWGNEKGAKVVDNWDFSPPPFPTVFNQLSVCTASRLQLRWQAANSILGWTDLNFYTHSLYSFFSLTPFFLFFFILHLLLFSTCLQFSKPIQTHIVSHTHAVFFSVLSLPCKFCLLAFIDYVPWF